MIFSFARYRIIACALCSAFALVTPGLANAWTDKPVRLIVPAPPGGTIDVVARLLSDELTQELKQPVIVENKPGAGGVVAVQAAMSAPPDGRALLVTPSNLLTETPLVVKVNFDPFKDLSPVAVVARTQLVLVGSPALAAKDTKSLVAWVKANPGTVSFASYSAGTVSHFAGMVLNRQAGLDMQHVPFLGAPPALAQIMGGQIPLMFDAIPSSRPLIMTGKLKAFGVTSRTRSPYLPEVPTLAEQGFADLEFGNWLGVVATANVPLDIQEKIRAVIIKLTHAPKLKERLTAAGFEVGSDEPLARLVQSVRTDYDRNSAIVKAFDIKLNQ